MLKTLPLCLALGLLPGLAWATCPPPASYADAEGLLLERLATARSEMESREIGGQIWELYLSAPDATAQALLDQGMERRRLGDYESSVAILDELITYCPAYAEGWNQRAFSHFLRADFSAALSDLEEALRLSPRHVPAMSGLALTLMGMGRTEAAQRVLRDAVDMNPFLPERVYLVGPKGEDI